MRPAWKMTWWAAIVLLLWPGAAGAQEGLLWRNTLSGWPARPGAATSASQVAQFERDLRLATPYLLRSQPADYAANRVLVRRMALYLAGLQELARDPQMRAAVRRAQDAYQALAVLPWMTGYGSVPGANGTGQIPAEEPAAPRGGARTIPFSLSAPALSDVAAAEKKQADELSGLYEADAGRAAGAWESAEALRQSLASRGMGLNSGTAASMLRVSSYLNEASDCLRRHAWEEARQELERAEAETDKIGRTVGR